MNSQKENNQQIAIFDNPAFGRVRCITDETDPWFVAKDVCDILCLENVTEAVRALDDDEKAEFSIPEVSSKGVVQRRNMISVSESGLYVLIFKSRKQEAKAFRKWVTKVVLPSIRRTGKYSIHPGIASNGKHAFEKTSLLSMLDAIFSYVGLDNDEKVKVLDKIWEKNFGCSVLACAKENASQHKAEEGVLDSAILNSVISDSALSNSDLLSPSQIGKLISPRRTGKVVNDILCEIGLQYYDNGYYPTEEGKNYAIATSQYAVNLRWKPAVLALIKNRAKQSSSGGDFCL